MKPTYRKPWAGSLILWSDLTLVWELWVETNLLYRFSISKHSLKASSHHNNVMSFPSLKSIPNKCVKICYQLEDVIPQILFFLMKLLAYCLTDLQPSWLPVKQLSVIFCEIVQSFSIW